MYFLRTSFVQPTYSVRMRTLFIRCSYGVCTLFIRCFNVNYSTFVRSLVWDYYLD